MKGRTPGRRGWGGAPRRGSLPAWGAWILVLGLAACSTDRAIGARFRAERDQWHLDREMERLSIRPDLVTPAEWRALAARYEGLAPKEKTAGTTPAAADLRALEARALVRAGQLYGALQDSTHMLQLYARVETDYADVPSLYGEVAFARGKMAEGRREWENAIEAYRAVLEKVTLRAGGGIQGAALELPLRMARLSAVVAGDTAVAVRAPHYREARRTYERLIEGSSDTLTAIEARGYLADAAGDLAEWPTALKELRALEALLRGMNAPAKDPAGARYAAAEVERRMGDREAARLSLNALVADYPKSTFAPRALIALATEAASAGRTEESLTFLGRVREEYPEEEDLSAQALFLRGRILESANRWNEAMEVFRSLPVEHPVSEPALQAPLEIARHYERVGDAGGRRAALERAETQFREFLERYPEGPPSVSAREKLIATLTLLDRKPEALEELVGMGNRFRGTPQGANYYVNAARLAYSDLRDTARAAEILEQAASAYGTGEFGRWASAEAMRLRGEGTP